MNTKITLREYAPHLVSEWDQEGNGDLTPDLVTYGSQYKAAWICAKGHLFRASVASRTRGSGCPYCEHRLAIPGETDLETLFPDISAEWNYLRNGSLNPRKILPGSNQKVWWACDQGHQWAARVCDRTSKNTACPYCNGRTVCVTRLV